MSCKFSALLCLAFALCVQNGLVQGADPPTPPPLVCGEIADDKGTKLGREAIIITYKTKEGKAEKTLILGDWNGEDPTIGRTDNSKGSTYLGFTKDVASKKLTLQVKDFEKFMLNEDKNEVKSQLSYNCTKSTDQPQHVILRLDVVEDVVSPPTFYNKDYTFEVPVPLPIEVNLYDLGAKLNAQFLSNADKLGATVEGDIFDVVVEKSSEELKKYNIVLKTKKPLDIDQEMKVNVTLMGQTHKDATGNKTIVLKPALGKSVPSFAAAAQSYIKVPGGADERKEIMQVKLIRGNAAEANYFLVPSENIKEAFTVEGNASDTAKIFAEQGAIAKLNNAKGEAYLVLNANVGGFVTHYNFSVLLSNGANSDDSTECSKGGLIAAVVILVLLCIATSGGTFYYWRKIRGMSSTYP